MQKTENLNKEREERKFYAAIKKIRKESQPKRTGYRDEKIVNNIVTVCTKYIMENNKIIQK